MGVIDLLSQKRTTIVQKWFDRIVQTYPAKGQNFIKEQKDRFANPVGSTILQAVEGLYAELLREMETGKVTKYLDSLMRVQAVQGFPPSEALSFIPSLKGIIRGELKREMQEMRVIEELSQFETRIDQLTLLAFDHYMRCREKIYEIRMQEMRAQSAGVMERIQGGEARRVGTPGLPKVTGDSGE